MHLFQGRKIRQLITEKLYVHVKEITKEIPVKAIWSGIGSPEQVKESHKQLFTRHTERYR